MLIYYIRFSFKFIISRNMNLIEFVTVIYTEYNHFLNIFKNIFMSWISLWNASRHCIYNSARRNVAFIVNVSCLSSFDGGSENYDRFDFAKYHKKNGEEACMSWEHDEIMLHLFVWEN